MRLSEHEQRVLAELEGALTADDPRFMQQFAPGSVVAPVLRRLGARRPDK
jgi:hypothetical protein